MSDATWVLEKEHCEAMSALAEEIDREESKMLNEFNCTDCVLDETDACPKGAGRAIDDEPCEEFIGENREMTNEELIKSKSTWDLAEFIYNVSNGATKISTCTNLCEECEVSDGYCISNIAEWLQEKAE